MINSFLILRLMEKSDFLKFYANLPIPVRGEVILDLPERGPITWEVAYREINGDTELGKIILAKLIENELVSPE
jgi:hypothetical protein